MARVYASCVAPGLLPARGYQIAKDDSTNPAGPSSDSKRIHVAAKASRESRRKQDWLTELLIEWELRRETRGR